jgi:hypothetical protein
MNEVYCDHGSVFTPQLACPQPNSNVFIPENSSWKNRLDTGKETLKIIKNVGKAIFKT